MLRRIKVQICINTAPALTYQLHQPDKSPTHHDRTTEKNDTMHLSILALVPLASAAAIRSRQEGPSTIGYWNAYYSTDVAANGDASRNVTAVYHNEKHGVEIVSTSLTVRPAGKPETETHTNENFKFYWADDWETPGTSE
jgi:hypothetical protein